MIVRELGFPSDSVSKLVLAAVSIRPSQLVRISGRTLVTKYVLRFSGRQLRLADLTGVQLKRLDGTADLAGTANYKITPAWALAIHINPGTYDGFVYMSRHLNTAKAVVLFDRAASKLKLKSSAELSKADGFAEAAALFGILAL